MGGWLSWRFGTEGVGAGGGGAGKHRRRHGIAKAQGTVWTLLARQLHEETRGRGGGCTWQRWGG